MNWLFLEEVNGSSLKGGVYAFQSLACWEQNGGWLWTFQTTFELMRATFWRASYFRLFFRAYSWELPSIDYQCCRQESVERLRLLTSELLSFKLCTRQKIQFTSVYLNLQLFFIWLVRKILVTLFAENHVLNTHKTNAGNIFTHLINSLRFSNWVLR